MNRDGCDCPAWIERCAHLGDVALFLTDRHIPSLAPFPVSLRYLVGREEPQTISFFYTGDDHDEALSAFHDLEKELIASCL